MKSVPAWSFGSSNRAAAFKMPTSPGPAQYDSRDSAVLIKQEGGFSMGRMKRKFDLTSGDVPGPG